MEARYGIVVKWLSQQTFNLPIPSSSLGGSTIFKNTISYLKSTSASPRADLSLVSLNAGSVSFSVLKYGIVRSWTQQHKNVLYLDPSSRGLGCSVAEEHRFESCRVVLSYFSIIDAQCRALTLTGWEVYCVNNKQIDSTKIWS